MDSPFFDGVNQAIDYLVIGLLLIGAIIWNARSLITSVRKEIKKETKRVGKESHKNKQPSQQQNAEKQSAVWLSGAGKALYTWLIAIAIQVFFLFIFLLAPILLIKDNPTLVDTVRWAELYIFAGLFSHLMTRKYGSLRGVYSMVGHLTVLLLGWLLGRWFGVLFVSMPLIAIYYHLIYCFAEVIIPASDPENRKEKSNRFRILAAYMWGYQPPILIVDDQTSMKAETRISGDMFQDYPLAPGYIWTPMPQAIGITDGMNFTRVDGPGAVYTKKYERPIDVIDLRTQLRTTEINAFTQDGIPIKAVVFMSFRVDNTIWDRKQYEPLRKANTLLRGGMLLDRGNNHFQYSSTRVRAVLSMEGVRTNISGPVGLIPWRWDEQVVFLVAEAARRVISELPLCELWVPDPADDGQGISALDLIADRIKDEKNPDGLFFTLQKNGVMLYVARVVNYFSLNDDPQKDKFGEFTAQQIPVWRARWERHIGQKLAKASAEAEQKQMDATALARSMLLTSIAESLQKVNNTHNTDFTRYLVAMRFLGALDKLIGEATPLEGDEKWSKIREKFALLRNLPFER